MKTTFLLMTIFDIQVEELSCLKHFRFHGTQMYPSLQNWSCPVKRTPLYENLTQLLTVSC